jgi:hypothetical protein
MKRITASLLGLLMLSATTIDASPVTTMPRAQDPLEGRRWRRFMAWVRASTTPLRVPRWATIGLSIGLAVLGLPVMVGAFGVTDKAAITTNDLVKRFIPTIIPTVEEQDAFAPFFKVDPKPQGIDKTMNYVIDSTVNEAARYAPGQDRTSKKREGYEVEVHILDKLREPWQIYWEKINQGRFNEVEIARDKVVAAVVRARIREQGRFLFTAAAFNSGTPTDPTAPSTGETPNWWNTNDTKAPPTFGENTFSAGHDHVETGAASAVSMDRLLDLRKLITEHGYGARGLIAMVESGQEVAIAKLANVSQQNVTLNPVLREDLQRTGRVSGLNGLLGMTWIQNDYTPTGVLGMWDAHLASLPQGGAVKVEAIPLTPDSEEHKGTQSTWIEATEQHGFGILHKGAGLTAHLA